MIKRNGIVPTDSCVPVSSESQDSARFKGSQATTGKEKASFVRAAVLIGSSHSAPFR